MIRLLLVDDHPVVRDGVKACLASQSQMQVVGEAENAETALALARELNPDIVIMDIGLGESSGLQVTRTLHDTLADIRVIILTIHDDKEYVLQSLRCGARGYLPKNAPPKELIDAVVRVHSGNMYLSAGLSDFVLKELSKQSDEAKPKLSRREQEVQVFIAEGYANKAIAQELNVSVRTVETHRENVMRKLDLHSVAELTKYALSEGFVSLR